MSVFAQCVRRVCSQSVFAECVRTVCSHSVFAQCVHAVCSHSVFAQCVRTVCSQSVFAQCVRTVCLHSVFAQCVRAVCSHSVFAWCDIDPQALGIAYRNCLFCYGCTNISCRFSVDQWHHHKMGDIILTFHQNTSLIFADTNVVRW